jgi:pimeloyl-ACP methyl ester carboxylesterase
MLKYILFSLFILSYMITYSQNIVGSWKGSLEVSGQSLPLIFNISLADDEKSYQATMDSPAQGASGIPVSSVSFENNELSLAMPATGISYQGTLAEANLINGIFKQGGFTTSLSLVRVEEKVPALNRPQEPKKPYPYQSENITFENKKADVTLAGTLTFPSGDRRYPAVVLITGSGPQNRDEEIRGHKPFLVLADYLTRSGIAVLRYDDRGVGESTGSFQGSTSYDFAEDAVAAVEYLKTRPEINHEQIGLIGHSEGGLIAPMIASENSEISFIVLMAGPGLRGDKVLLEQKSLIEAQMGIPQVAIDRNYEIFTGAYNMIIGHQEGDLKEKLTNYFREKYGKGLPQDQLNNIVAQLANPWMVGFIKADPARYLPGVSCPVLAINGAKDLQVPSKENLKAIEKQVKSGGNTAVTTKEFPGLNHLFQECETGLPDEYGKIEQTIAPEVLEIIGKWVNERVK